MSIAQSAIPVNKVEFTTNKRITNAKLTVAAKDSLTNLTAPSGEVYKYLNITGINLSESSLTLVKIYFNVTQSWIDDNNVSKTDIVLHRYVNGTWLELSTAQVVSTTNQTKFKATTPGFSFFAITGPKTQTAAAVVTPTATNETDEETETQVVAESIKEKAVRFAEPYTQLSKLGNLFSPKIAVIAGALLTVFITLLVYEAVKTPKKKQHGKAISNQPPQQPPQK